ncbi:MAG: GerMN domain-containing protein [Firmicutes bacterium]|nr:GerMN domain-containing protein [Bacillota bacterium]
MKGRRLKLITAIFVALSFVVSGCSLLGEGKPEDTTNKPSGVSINYYYLEKTTSLLKSEMKSVPDGSVEDIVEYVISTIKDAPVNENYNNVIPKNVEFKSHILKDKALVLNLSGEYNELKSGEELLARAALVWTFTEIDGVDSVEIKVNGNPLMKTNGGEIGPMKREDVVIDTIVETQPTNEEMLTLYFGDDNATKLEKEIRKVSVNPNQPVERYVVEQLIAGPAVKGHISTIPSETKIRDIKTADGICYLDLSADFVNKHNGGSTGELMTIFSIVNSLCELEHIDTVQFLIEGEKQDEYKGHIEFSNPFMPNYDISF